MSAVKGLAGTAALACNGATDVTVTLTGHAGETGSATDTELVLDVSGSMAPPKLDQLKAAATAFVQALDARDGNDDGILGRGNRVGIVTYQNSTATTLTGLGFSTSEPNIVAAIGALTTVGGGSPHNLAIAAAQGNLSGTGAKAIVLITDGLTNSPADQTAAANAANAAKTAGIRIETIGIGAGSGVDAAALQSWATQTPTGADNYQSGTATPINADELVKDVGAAVAVPASFSVVESTGTHFVASAPSVSAGTSVVAGTGTLTWTGSLNEGQQATLQYHVIRDGSDVYSVAPETISSSAVSVTGGTATITPAGGVVSRDVLPCGVPLAQQTCTGSACTAAGTQGGLQYSVNAGTPSGTTDLFLTGLTTPPPPGACPGFNANVSGVQFDIRPLTTDGTFQIVIPKSVLTSTGKKWWQTEVCLGTNLRFITQLNSLSNLRPGATLVGGGTLPGRWWGLLPSIPRLTYQPTLGWIRGPWIKSRSVDGSGNAVIKFVVPYIGNSAPVTEDHKAAYDPKAWGG